jgi:hypothetical protein
VYVFDNPRLLTVGYLIYKDSSMTKIININKSYQPLTIESYITAAWHFVLLALWPFEKIKKDKIERCQYYIKSYLLAIPETQASFITFCEKVLLVNRTLSASPSVVIDPPAVWLNPNFAGGYASTDEIHRLIRINRIEPPHYLEGITVLAKGYWDFINQPTPPVLSKIHDRLYSLRQYDLISLLGHVTLKYILVSKQLI